MKIEFIEENNNQEIISELSLFNTIKKHISNTNFPKSIAIKKNNVIQKKLNEKKDKVDECLTLVNKQIEELSKANILLKTKCNSEIERLLEALLY
jgi:hypothetical protein